MAGFTLAQQSSTLISAASPTPITLPSTTTAGNLIVIKFAYATTGSASIDSGFSKAIGFTDSTISVTENIFYLANAPSVGAGSTIATVTYSGGGGSAACCEEWTPPAGTTVSLDQTGSSTTTSGTSASVSTSAVITADDELAVSIHWAKDSTATSVTISAGSGFTRNTVALNNGSSALQHTVFCFNGDTGASSSGTTITDAATLSSSTHLSGTSSVIATFQATAAASPQVPNHLISQYGGFF